MDICWFMGNMLRQNSGFDLGISYRLRSLCNTVKLNTIAFGIRNVASGVIAASGLRELCRARSLIEPNPLGI